MPYLHAANRADIWIAPPAGAEAANITHGASDGSGYWAAQWSPTGRRLAMASTKGGDNVRLYAWDKDRGELKRLTDRGVDIGWSEIIAADGTGAPFLWKDDSHIIQTELSDGAIQTDLHRSQIVRQTAERNWAKQALGHEPTVSVVDSVRTGPTGTEDLEVLNVETGARQVIGRIPFSRRRWIVLDSAMENGAVLTEVAPRPMSADTKPANRYFTRIGLFSTSHAGIRWLIQDEAVTHLLAWSVDGKRLLALVAGQPGDGRTAEFPLLVDADTGASKKLEDLAAIDAAVSPAPGWFLVHTRATNDADRRADWFSISPSNRTRNETSTMQSPPQQLFYDPGSDRLVGFSDGTMVVASKSGDGFEFSSGPRLSIQVRQVLSARGNPLRLLATTSEQKLVLISFPGPRVDQIQAPASSTALAAVDPQLQRLAVGVSDQDGTSVWFCNLGEPAPPREVLRVNKHLASVKSSSRKFLDYVTADGKGLKALALLPPDYRPETRYPMVVWVYAGMLVDQSSRPDLSFDDDAFDNPRLLAGHGYLVLFPSIPLTPYGQPGDPVSQMTASVTSAVDRAVADGLADPARVGVIGHSYGGYTTLSLVTRTHRFAAAVAIAGTSDLFSFYGGFDPHDRYSDPLISQPFGPGLFELSQFRMGKPPWEDPQRYLRNSPVLHLDQTTTPLMLIAGDLDPAMAQAEETSTALARLGKTGRLVRYYGEDHVLDSPANIRDMWQRIFAWTDKYLKG